MSELQTWRQDQGISIESYRARNGDISGSQEWCIDISSGLYNDGVHRFMSFRISSFIHIQSLSVARNKMNYSMSGQILWKHHNVRCLKRGVAMDHIAHW